MYTMLLLTVTNTATATSQGFAALIVKTGVVEALAQLLQRDDVVTRQSCGLCLCNVIRFGVKIRTVIAAGAVQALVRPPLCDCH
jgi:hypothetical protein